MATFTGLAQRTLRLVPKAEDSWLTPTQIMHASVERLAELGVANEWARRHMMAWEFADVVKSTGGTQKLEAAIRDAIIAWARYAEVHRAVHGSNIGKDQILGVAWKAQAQALLIQLNGELGRLDGGSLDKIIREVAETCGVDLEV